jgi:hypothetical protein
LSSAQFFKDNLYYEGEINGVVALFVKDQLGQVHSYSLGGINFRGGVGIHDGEGYLFLGIHSGMDGNFRHHAGILPVYLNSKFAFDVSENYKLALSFGYGKSFQIGPENLTGFLHKYTIEFAQSTKSKNLESISVEIINYGFYFPDDGTPAITLNLGFKYTFL